MLLPWSVGNKGNGNLSVETRNLQKISIFDAKYIKINGNIMATIDLSQGDEEKTEQKDI